MSDTIEQTVGVDISKDTLDVHLHPAGKARRFANTRMGRSGLIAWLAEFTITRIVFEPTGPYHHGFERQLAEAGQPLAKVNPRQARRFAERSVGTPRLMPLMLPCSPALQRSSSRRCAQL